MSERLLHWLTRLLLLVVVGAGIGAVVKGVSSSEFHVPERPQVVTLLDDPLPEPEDIIEPELEEPELEEQFEEIVQPDFEGADDVAQLDDLLGLDGDAAAGFDGFGLVAKRGGADLVRTRPSQANIARIGDLLERHLTRALELNDTLRRQNYTVLVKLWIDDAGYVSSVQIASSTGDADLDQRIERALEAVPPFQANLGNVPQPVRIRITTRGARSTAGVS